MRVLLVTLTDLLPYALTKVLNPSLEYCAIVVDDATVAKNMLKDVKPLQNLIYPFYELKECIQNFHYDVVICYSFGHDTFESNLRRYGVSKNKLVNLVSLHSHENFLLERALRYYSEYAGEFEMFATGMSYTECGLEPQNFKLKLFNFGRGTQDLYYDYKIAQFVFTHAGGGAGKISS